MTETIVHVPFPRGELPVRGFRCERCSEEVVLGGDAAAVQVLARELGMMGLEGLQRRKLLRTGNSTGVSLDPEWLRSLGVRPGDEVEVGRQGGAIVIRPVERAEAS